MTEFRIGIEIGHLLPPGGPLTPDLFPSLAHAVQEIAQRGQAIWMGYAGGAPLPDGSTIQSRTHKYLNSIQLSQLGPFSAEIFSELPYARIIEDGAPARDMKRMLDTSMKVRRFEKSGKRYLIIPFQWGTPGTTGFGRNVMTHETHAAWRDPALTPSRVTGLGKRPSGNGAHDIRTRSPFLVSQRQYHWGGRLTKPMLNSLGVHGRAAKHMAGMVNMQNPSGQGGGGKHSSFMTFRVMVEGSPGWLVPAQAGKHPARTTAERLRPVAEKAFAAAVAGDLKSLTGAG